MCFMPRDSPFPCIALAVEGIYTSACHAELLCLCQNEGIVHAMLMWHVYSGGQKLYASVDIYIVSLSTDVVYKRDKCNLQCPSVLY